MTFAGWTLAQLWPLFAAGGGAITLLYLLRMRRRQVVVPFAALWERVTRESESRRLWRRLRRLLSWLLQLVVLALVCLLLRAKVAPGRALRWIALVPAGVALLQVGLIVAAFVAASAGLF